MMSFDDSIAILERFRAAVWGNKQIFKWESEGSRTVQYLDFGDHLDAVQAFCDAISGPRLLVVQEYREAMKNLGVEGAYKNGACILGHPGIGKSCFIAYAVIELLREKRPVAVQVPFDRRSYFLFSERDVIVSGFADDLISYPGLWAFSDSNHFVETPTLAFTRALRFGVRVFQMTRPERRRYAEWTEYYGIRQYIMDFWSNEEIMDFAHVSGYEAERTTALTEKWGPIPRTLRMLYETPEEEKSLEISVTNIAHMTVIDPDATARALIYREGPFEGDQGLLALFFMKHKDVWRSCRCIVVPTRWLARQLLNTVAARLEHNVTFFHAMSICSVESQLFKEYIRLHFDCRKRITIHWFDKAMATPDTMTLPQLQQHAHLNDVTTNSYWLPEHSDIPGIDGLFVTYCVYLLQDTTSNERPNPQKGLDKIWQSTPALHNLRWRFLFIGFTPRNVLGGRTYTERFKVGVDTGVQLPVGRITI